MTPEPPDVEASQPPPTVNYRPPAEFRKDDASDFADPLEGATATLMILVGSAFVLPLIYAAFHAVTFGLFLPAGIPGGMLCLTVPAAVAGALMIVAGAAGLREHLGRDDE